MMAMPQKTQLVTNLSLGSYFRAVGTNSLKDMGQIRAEKTSKNTNF